MSLAVAAGWISSFPGQTSHSPGGAIPTLSPEAKECPGCCSQRSSGHQRGRVAGPRALKGPLRWSALPGFLLLVSSELLPQNCEKSLDLFITLFIFF